MPTFSISDQTLARLQPYATPLIDSFETTLVKVLDLADSVSTNKSGGSFPPKLASAPDLTHTTLQSASIDGRSLRAGHCNWNGLMMAVVEQAAKYLPNGAEIADLIVVNHVLGQKEDNGYKFLKGVGVSIQGQNSNNAWKAIANIAKHTGVKVEANFYWSNHPKAARPGESSQLVA